MSAINMSTNDDSDKSCPICLNEMSVPDIAHPINCPTACKFNFCIQCLSSLLKSSKDDYQMASDGNRHVKVRLNCPNCRADISKTIQDTIQSRRKALTEELRKIPDSQLSAQELRSKHESETYDTTNQQRNSSPSSFPPMDIDPTLFGGLEFAMTEQEQTYVTKLMTSGYPDQLCQAAQIISGIAELIRQGVSPSIKNAQNGANANRTVNSVPLNSAAASTARTTVMLQGGYSNTAGIGLSRDPTVSSYQRQVEQMAREKLRRPLPARLPLSVTLSTAEFEKMAITYRQQTAPQDPVVERKSWLKGFLTEAAGSLRGDARISFVDDEWDGSVADAFARAQIGPLTGNRKKYIVQKRLNNRNAVEQMSINKILAVKDVESLEGISAAPQDELVPKRTHRVLVASVRGQAGKSGVMKGDVVTHVNGEIFTGDAASLNLLLVKSYEEQGKDGVVILVVNADECTAEALRLRSQIR